MECGRWADEGLLFMARELDPAREEAYRRHLSECLACRRELDDYTEMKRTVLLPEVLGEAPSATVDAEILRVCSRRVRRITGIPVFASVARKTAVAAAFLLAGFLGTGYFVYVMQNPATGNKTTVAGNRQNVPSVNPSEPVPSQVADAASADSGSAADSAESASVRPFSAQTGDLSSDRVQAVGVENPR